MPVQKTAYNLRDKATESASPYSADKKPGKDHDEAGRSVTSPSKLKSPSKLSSPTKLTSPKKLTSPIKLTSPTASTPAKRPSSPSTTTAKKMHSDTAPGTASPMRTSSPTSKVSLVTSPATKLSPSRTDIRALSPSKRAPSPTLQTKLQHEIQLHGHQIQSDLLTSHVSPVVHRSPVLSPTTRPISPNKNMTAPRPISPLPTMPLTKTSASPPKPIVGSPARPLSTPKSPQTVQEKKN